MLGEGDAVGADARLMSASALRVQEASLTGESAAVPRARRPWTKAVPLGDRHNMVYKGTAVAQGVGRAVVTDTGMATEMGAIAEMLDATVEEPTPLQHEINRISKMLGVIVVVIALVVMITIVVVDGITEPMTSSSSCCWASRWPSRRCPKDSPPSCLSCSRSVCNAWRSATPWSRSSTRSRPSDQRPSSARTRPAP